MEENKASVISIDASVESPSASVERADTGTRVVRSILRHERLYLLATVSVFALAAVYKALTTPLWFDEFFTLFLSHWSSIPELLKAIPADGQPPLQYMLTHVSWAWLGVSEFSVRLPDILAYIAVGFLTYRIVHRHGTAVQALFATAAVMGSGVVAYQAYTARPYELVLAFTALVFACWQVAADRESARTLPLCGITVGIAGAILSHHFGVIFVGLLLGAGEATRLIQRRRVDWGILLASVAGLTPLIITIPLARESHVLLGEPVLRSKNFCCSPSATYVVAYGLLVPLLLALWTIVLMISVRPSEHSSPDRDVTPSSVPAHEWAATIVLSLLVPLQIVLAYIATNYFLPRYAIPTTLGLALLGGWGLPRIRALHRTWQPVLGIATLGFLLFVMGCLALEQAYYPAWQPQLRKKAVPSLLLDAPGQLPIVVGNAFDYAPEWWYSPPSIRKRLIYLSDASYAVKQQDFLPELSLDLDRADVPFPVSDYRTFIEGHRSFLVLCTGMPRRYWVQSRLLSAGWHLSQIARHGNNVLYRADRGH